MSAGLPIPTVVEVLPARTGEPTRYRLSNGEIVERVPPRPTTFTIEPPSKSTMTQDQHHATNRHARRAAAKRVRSGR